ncbi:hypothetical protein DFJ73DRAFT_655669, partial [Zopfochytrium polystomum]
MRGAGCTRPSHHWAPYCLFSFAGDDENPQRPWDKCRPLPALPSPDSCCLRLCSLRDVTTVALFSLFILVELLPWVPFYFLFR